MVRDPASFAIESAALRLTARRAPLDEETFGIGVAQIVQVEVLDPAKAILDFRRFTDWCQTQCITLCSARISHSCTTENTFLQERNFRFVESAYRVSLEGLASLQLPESEVVVSDANPHDCEELVAMAETMFRFGRYHRDPRIDSAAADERYGQWVARAFANPDQRVIRCSHQNAIVGFFVVEAPGRSERYWSLVGLSPAYSGKGLGKQAWISMLRRHKCEGVEKVSSRISAHNLPITNLYARLGFRFDDPNILLQWRAQEPDKLTEDV